MDERDEERVTKKDTKPCCPTCGRKLTNDLILFIDNGIICKDCFDEIAQEMEKEENV